MVDNVTCIIPARGGSKGIKKKNIKLFMGRPLISWHIERLEKIPNITNIVVSTDSNEIAEISLGCSKKVIVRFRPLAISGDMASTEDAIIDAIINCNDINNKILLLQATSPFTDPDDIGKAIYAINNYDSMFSAVRLHSFPWKDFKPLDWLPAKRPMRQHHAGITIETGAFYIFDKNGFLKSKVRQFGNIGIIETAIENLLELDSMDDWVRCEIMASSLPWLNKLFG